MDFTIPKTTYKFESTETSMSRYCDSSIDCACNCGDCLFGFDNMTEERVQAFLKWKSEQPTENE